MKKNIIIALLIILVLSLGGYLIYDKLIATDLQSSTNEKPDNQDDKEISYDLTAAEELVEKYFFNSSYFGGDLFTDDFNNEMKMLIALNNIPSDQIGFVNCDEVYGKTLTPNYELYYVNLSVNSRYNTGVCANTTQRINYLNANQNYKELFGSSIEMPKEDLSMGTRLFQYNEDYESFISLSCEYGGADPRMRIYGIKEAKVVDNQLIVNVGYTIFSPVDDVDWQTYTADFDNSITYSQEELATNTNLGQELVEKHFDKMAKHELVFENDNNNYVLTNVIKK